MQTASNQYNPPQASSQDYVQIHSARKAMSQSAISMKREQFHSSIRKETIRIQFNQVRQQLVTNERSQIVTSLYQTVTSSKELTPKQFEVLLQFANKQDDNAIIVLGNLIIDKLVLPNQVGEKIQLGNSQYWGWLFRVMQEHDYCEKRFIEHSMDIITKSSRKKLASVTFLENHLIYVESLLRVRQQQVIQILCNQAPFLVAILNLTGNNEKALYSLAISILGRIIRNSDLIELFTSQKKIPISSKALEKHFENILLKSQQHLRGLGVQMLTNLAFSQIVFLNTLLLLMNTSVKQKAIVKVQISFYWLTILQICSDQIIVSLIERGLVFVLTDFLENQKQTVQQNARGCVEILTKKFASMGAKGMQLWVSYGLEGILEKINKSKNSKTTMDLE